MDPSVSFDLVHVTLSLHELFALFAQGFDLIKAGFCALPFVTSC